MRIHCDDLVGANLAQPHRPPGEGVAGGLVDDPQLAARVRTAHAAALLARELLVVLQVPSGDAAAELGGRVRREHRHAVPGGERLGEVGIERRGPRHDGLHAGEVGGIEVGVVHHAQGGRDEAHGAGLVSPHGVDPWLDREPFEQRERPTVGDRLDDAEQPTKVDHRRVHDDHAGAESQLFLRVRLVVLRALHDALERVVGEVDAARGTGGAAREHAHGDAR